MAIDTLSIASAECDYSSGSLSPVMYECDPDAIGRLELEIAELKVAGFDVAVGKPSDEAYESGGEVIRVYGELESVNDAVDEVRKRQTSRWPGYIATAPKNWHERWKAIQKKHYIGQDEVRNELLYGPSATDSQAWHDQRGRAPALLSITSAHELAVYGQPIKNGRHQSMSGPLDETIFDYRFPAGMRYIGGEDLNSAIRISEMQHSNVMPDIAAMKAEKRLTKLASFIHSTNSEGFIDIAKYSTDSLGIRGRMHDMGEVMEDHLIELHESGIDLDKEFIVSVGSGTAFSVLEVMKRLKTATNSCPTAILVDQDPISLAAAVQLAEQMHLGDKIEIHCERLFSKTGIPLKLDKILDGRRVILSEDAGLREYLPNQLYKRLGAELWSNVKPGGLMATANMNKNRPQKRFLQGGMGWQPNVQMRSIGDCISLHKSIGVGMEQLRAQTTYDGVYTAYYSAK